MPLYSEAGLMPREWMVVVLIIRSFRFSLRRSLAPSALQLLVWMRLIL